MNTISLSHIPFAELPVEARALFFINALAAVARYGARPPKQSELTLVLETIWNGNRLGLKISPTHYALPPCSDGVTFRLLGWGCEMTTATVVQTRLSPSERRERVALGVTAGKSNRAIAKELGVD
jgi:hypothetical protein